MLDLPLSLCHNKSKAIFWELPHAPTDRYSRKNSSKLSVANPIKWLCRWDLQNNGQEQFCLPVRQTPFGLIIKETKVNYLSDGSSLYFSYLLLLCPLHQRRCYIVEVFLDCKVSNLSFVISTIWRRFMGSYWVITRPGVAEPVPQTPLSLTKWLTHSIFVNISSTHVQNNILFSIKKVLELVGGGSVIYEATRLVLHKA